ncbi:hypothetical protein A6S26_31965 [Nostoc sp. ATCC 43529]|nr:hypothetical protein A6S26_31965 [Nostoc sp. ATCC 43529]
MARFSKKREENKKSKLHYAIALILKIDPSSFDVDRLQIYGIEVIADLEDGCILGISFDIELNELQKKIEKFINQELGGNKIAEIWEILDSSRKLEYILDQNLIEHWYQIKDDQIYTVDVGISCIGSKPLFPNYPKRKLDESDAQFIPRINNWIKKCHLIEQERDEIKSEREEQFKAFIQEYKGIYLKNADEDIPNLAQLSDSFSCRIQIKGQGLKDLVFNFPYIFDVSLHNENLDNNSGSSSINNNQIISQLKEDDTAEIVYEQEVSEFQKKLVKLFTINFVNK